MEKIGFLEIRISGTHGNIQLSPETYDIKEIMVVLQSAEDLLFPSEKKDRPVISYSISEGSVKHVFKTSMQWIVGFNAVLGQVIESQNIDFLDVPTAKAIEVFQETAIKKDYKIFISTSSADSNLLQIDRSTRFMRSQSLWVDAEFYFYGRVTNAGGKDKANIHIVTEGMGTVRIDTPIAFLEEYEENLLYKDFGVRASAKQHSETGEIDRSSVKFLELIDYQPRYDEDYLKRLRQKAKKTWLKSIDPDKWLRGMRGGYE